VNARYCNWMDFEKKSAGKKATAAANRESLTFNQVVASSILARLTNENKPLRRIGAGAFFLGSPRDHLGNQF